MAVQEKQRVLSGLIHMGEKIVFSYLSVLLGNANYQGM